MLTQSYTNNQIDTIYRLRQVFYRCLYTGDSLNNLLDGLRIKLDPFTIYIGDDMTVNIRIKKSCMKKLSNFTHTPMFYYSFLYEVFYTFFAMNLDCIINEYNEVFGELTREEAVYHITDNISCFIDIHTLQDNIVIIRL